MFNSIRDGYRNWRTPVNPNCSAKQLPLQKQKSPYKTSSSTTSDLLALSLETLSLLHIGREFVSQSLRVFPDQRQVFLGSFGGAGLGHRGRGTGCLWKGCDVGGWSRWVAGGLSAMGRVCRVCTEFRRMGRSSCGGWSLFGSVGGGCNMDSRCACGGGGGVGRGGGVGG